MTGGTATMDSPSKHRSRGLRKSGQHPSSPSSPNSPTGVEYLDAFLQKRLAMQNGNHSPDNREQRRLRALGMIGENSSTMNSMRQKLERDLQAKQRAAAAKITVLNTIRKQRKEDYGTYDDRRSSLEKRLSHKEVASKYSGLSRGLVKGGKPSSPVPEKPRDSLRSFLAAGDTTSNNNKYLSMSQSLSGLSNHGGGDDEGSIAHSISSLCRSEQRWQSRADYCHSTSLLTGGHLQKKREEESDGETEAEDDVDTTEHDYASSEEEEAPEAEPRSKEEHQELPEVPQTPVASAPSKPKGILKRTSVIPATPLTSQTTHGTSETTTTARSMLHSLYDGGKTLSLQSMSVDSTGGGTSHQRKSATTPTTPTGRSGRGRSNSNRKLMSDGSSNRKLMGDGSGNRKVTTDRDGGKRKLKDGSSRKLQDGNSRKMKDGSSRKLDSRGSNRRLQDGSSKENDGSKQLSRSDSGRRMNSMSRAQSARRLKQRRGKTLEKSNSNSSRLSHNEEVEVVKQPTAFKRSSTEVISPKSTSKRGSDLGLPTGSTRDNPRKESMEKEGGIAARRRARSSTRNQRARRAASRSRTRRATAASRSKDAEQTAEEETAATTNTPNKRTSRRSRQNKSVSDRHLKKDRSDRNVRNSGGSSGGNKTTHSKEGDELDKTLAMYMSKAPATDSAAEDPDEVPDLLQFDPTSRHNVAVISADSPKPPTAAALAAAAAMLSPCDHQDLADDTNDGKTKKKRRASLGMKLPLWGKRS